ncbi:MAG TPA: DUF1071 domain-containing protein [Pseudogracilibacillus sp.]|nr:DUF1071 domain-containing protein [Pseudogracilibacillus sp.]
MALKPFNELFKVDLSNEVVDRPVKKNSKITLEYLEWANCIKLLYENGAEKVRYGMLKNDKGYPCFYNDNGESPFVTVWVRVDDEIYEEDYPIINGMYPVANPTQLDINKAKQRGFVKAVAINTGLGLKLWIKEEELVNGNPELQQETNDNEMQTLNNQLTTLFAQAIQKLGTADKVYSTIHSDKKEMMKLYRSNDHGEKKIIIEQLRVILNGQSAQG